MRTPSKLAAGLLLAALAALAAYPGLWAKDPEPKKEVAAKSDDASPVQPKPLSDPVKKALAYLVSQQQDNGGWGQGGGWRSSGHGGGRVEGKEVKDPPDVANTCVATLALLRAGHTPKEGAYAKNVAKAIDFICAHVEKADSKSIYVTDVRDTQVQVKIGPYVDTFLTALVLSELKGKMPDEKTEKRMIASLNKVIGKMEDNQKADGGFAGNNGWAAVLSQGLASKALNRAYQNGFAVKSETLDRDNKLAAAGLDTKSGTFKPAGTGAGGIASAGARAGRGTAASEPAAAAAPSDAGVGIYNASARTGALQETVNSLKGGEKKAKETLDSPKASKDEKEQAKQHLDRLSKAEEVQSAAVRGITKQLDDKQFVQGFGSNGGEEFLSFMNISETLLAKGGAEWEKWDKQVTENLNRIQDKDGGWSGHHCITGRTFCTASALLVLLADRAPVPTAAKMQPKK